MALDICGSERVDSIYKNKYRREKGSNGMGESLSQKPQNKWDVGLFSTTPDGGGFCLKDFFFRFAENLSDLVNI